MRKWGKNSLKQYETLDPTLAHYLDRALQEIADISLIQGHRNQEDQMKAYFSVPQRSKLMWPDGKHNSLPSLAVDFQPYPRPKSKVKLFAALGYIAGRIIQMAEEDGVVIRWGGDWDSDGDLTDQNFDDLFHLEIIYAKDDSPRVPAVPVPRSLG
jgi:hypothetical protein